VSSTQIFEGFSVSHACILNGTTGAELAQLYACRNGSVTPDTGTFENTGDDVVLSNWFWINFANVTIEEGFIPFQLVATITGVSVSSSGAAPNDYYSLPLWTLASMNQIARPMVVRCPAKDSSGLVYTLDFVLYKCQFMPLSFTGPSYKTGLSVSISARAIVTSTNEVGNPLPSAYPSSIGRLIAAPGNLVGTIGVEPFNAGSNS
jgi:hypothetical protein